jgi:SAM-dependent methyltransferase
MSPAPTCGICGGELVLRHRGSDGELTADALSPTCHTPGAHGDLYACRACGTVQQPAAPRGAELVDLYRDMRDDAYLDEEAGRRNTARRLLALLERHAPRRGRLLDVGCGPGLLLDEARRRGWEVLGLEPSAAWRSHATGTLGLDVRDGTMEDLDPTVHGGLDAIVMADVIEHFDDPPGGLRRCAALLGDGGVLLVVTPDPASRTARLAGARWWGLLPAHTYLLPRRTLRRLLFDAGLEPIADRSLWRSFTLGYWLGGLGERSGLAGRALAALRRLLPERLLVTLSLGDERVIVARRGAAARDVAPAPAAATTPAVAP